MWAIALLGFFSKIVLQHRIEGVGMVAYVVLGWMPVLGIKSAWELLPGTACQWFIIGGLCHTGGIPFLIYDHRRPFNHAIWHLLVIAGSSCHYYAIWQCVGSGNV
jgi:hemolysin III